MIIMYKNLCVALSKNDCWSYESIKFLHQVIERDYERQSFLLNAHSRSTQIMFVCLLNSFTGSLTSAVVCPALHIIMLIVTLVC